MKIQRVIKIARLIVANIPRMYLHIRVKLVISCLGRYNIQSEYRYRIRKETTRIGYESHVHFSLNSELMQ